MDSAAARPDAEPDVSGPRVALVLVSHSDQVAAGVVEIAEQMAPDVQLRAAGGTEDGRVGTSYDLVEAQVNDLLGRDDVAGVVLLTDLGSATLTAEAVLDVLDDDRAVLAAGPLVEGAVAGAVAAQTGGDLADVRRAVADAAVELVRVADAAAPQQAGSPHQTAPAPDLRPGPGDGPVLTRVLVLRNELGLHARPAALLARAMAGHDATVTLNGVAAHSVLDLMALGAMAGTEIVLVAAGRDAEAAVDEATALIEDGFGEGVL